MKVRTPAGDSYRVRRRWLPWRRKARARDMDWIGIPDIDDSWGIVVVAVVLVPLVVVLVILLGEFLLLLLLLPLVMLARALFGTPWTLEVTRKRSLVATERVRGWRASQERVEQLAGQLAAGDVSVLSAGAKPAPPSAH